MSDVRTAGVVNALDAVVRDLATNHLRLEDDKRQVELRCAEQLRHIAEVLEMAEIPA